MPELAVQQLAVLLSHIVDEPDAGRKAALQASAAQMLADAFNVVNNRDAIIIGRVEARLSDDLSALMGELRQASAIDQAQHAESLAAIRALAAYRDQMPAEERAKLRTMIYASAAELRELHERVADLTARIATIEALLVIAERQANGD